MKSELLFLIRARTQNTARHQQFRAAGSTGRKKIFPPATDKKRVPAQKLNITESQLWFVRPRHQPILLASAFALGCVNITLALDSFLPPGGNFNLSGWKLTLPDPVATEIPASQLGGGYTNGAFFYTGPDGAMVFWCPVTGGVTSGASYPRSELRELLVATNDNVNWTTRGTHTLEAQCRVLQVPSSKKVIIGQIHAFGGNAQPLVKLQYDNGMVEALVKISPYAEADTNYPFMPVALNTLISYRLQVTNGLLTITVNLSNQTVNLLQNHPAWAKQSLYFKAGGYCQDNLGTNTEGARVSFYHLTVTHSGDMHLATEGFNSSRQFGFNLLAYDAQTYAIQRSSNLFEWADVFTNPAPGSFNFLEIGTAPASQRFYRARQFP
jgi:hypothetical protein